MFETGIVKKCSINNEPKLLDSDLKKILNFCKENNITHIHEIIEKRFGIEINKSTISLNNILYVNNFNDYGIKFLNNEYITHLAYIIPEDEPYAKANSSMEESERDVDYDTYYDIDVNDLKYSENSIKDCYIFNEVSYSIKGVKTYPSEIVDDFILCKLDFEYFYNNYVKKNDDIK